MITTKQRAILRSLANTLDPMLQIGKDGITENTWIEINNLFEARELFKIKILKNCDYTPRELAGEIQAKTDCEIVQCIGNKLVVYKQSTRKNFKHIQLI